MAGNGIDWDEGKLSDLAGDFLEQAELFSTDRDVFNTGVELNIHDFGTSDAAAEAAECYAEALSDHLEACEGILGYLREVAAGLTETANNYATAETDSNANS